MKKGRRRLFAAMLGALVIAFTGEALPQPAVSGADWPEYLGGPDRNHYSTLSQINAQNLTSLQPAWEYHTGSWGGWLECNPIVIDGTLFGVTTSSGIFALDAATGRERWHFLPPETRTKQPLRGVVYWSGGSEQRILFTVDSWLCAIDARDGKPIAGFGNNGRVSLRLGLGEQARDKWVVSTTPGTLLGDLLIMPLRVSEGPDAGPGFIQAFNVRSGKLAWVFHTIPRPGEFGYETWSPQAYKNTCVGAANCWAGMAVDRTRGVIYVSTGSASPDFWGADRKGRNLFADCVLALDGRTGKRLWHYQFVHHDLWDMDLPAPPNLVSLRQNGRIVAAIAQVTKFGRVFVLDRVSGNPIFPIEEVSVPTSNLPGEQSSPTQPLPTKPAPFVRPALGEDDISPYAENRAELVDLFHRADRGLFHPILPGRETIVFPGFDGGAEWGGAAVDPDGVLYINANEVAWIAHLRKVEAPGQLSQLSPGNRLYSVHCISCHGSDRKGNSTSGFPSLVDLALRRDREEVVRQITTGKGMMPGFPMLSEEDKQTLVDFLFNRETSETASAIRPLPGPPTSIAPTYALDGYMKFRDSKGYPANRPPWGSLTAIDLNTGDLRWRTTLGIYKELSAKGVPPTGTENYGGPLITAAGVLFIAATPDSLLRAFDCKSGRLLWSHELPAGGFATPSTYAVGGKQYIVVACGGDRLDSKAGDSYMAFALP